jgi:hypothetical protein
VSFFVGFIFMLSLWHNYDLDFYSHNLDDAMKEADASYSELVAASVRITPSAPVIDTGITEHVLKYFPILAATPPDPAIPQNHGGIASALADSGAASGTTAKTEPGIKDIAFIIDMLTTCNQTDRPPEAPHADERTNYYTGIYEGNHLRSVTENAYRISFSMEKMLNYAYKLNLAEHSFPLFVTAADAAARAAQAERHPLEQFKPYIGVDRIINMPGDPIDIKNVVICKLKIFPVVRAYSTNVLSNKLSKQTAISLYTLPVITSVLGCIIHLIYFYRKDLMTKSSADILYQNEQLVASVLIGFCISLIVPLMRDWHGPLTVLAFVCGWLSESFGSILMNIVPRFFHGQSAPRAARTARTVSSQDYR